jgi:hypothetical protein
MDTVRGLPLTDDQQSARTSSEDNTGEIVDKKIMKQLNT